MKLIVGLGNPGNEYSKTRHNVGFMCMDEICKYFNVSLEQNKFDGLFGQKIINNEKVLFLKPLNYINLSGEVIKKFIDYFKINIEDILIIVDDMDLELGKYKLRYKGGSAGHNGLKNIELMLKTNEYKRIKIGISRNKNYDMKDYVLGKLSNEEFNKLNEVILKTPKIVEDFISIDFDKLMNKYN